MGRRAESVARRQTGVWRGHRAKKRKARSCPPPSLPQLALTWAQHFVGFYNWGRP